MDEYNPLLTHKECGRYTLRPASAADFDFIYSTARTTMRRYVEQLWGWDEQYQSDRFKTSFNPAEWRIILVRDCPAGAYNAKYEHTQVFLANIYILPEFQRLGIGSDIISDLISYAKSASKPVNLNVLTSNASAYRLYRRLGFHVVERTDEKIFMST